MAAVSGADASGGASPSLSASPPLSASPSHSAAPSLSVVPADGAVPEDLLDRVQRRLAGSADAAGPVAVASAVRAEAGLVSDAHLLRLIRQTQDALVGAGPLADLIADPATTDVVVNGPADVRVDRGAGWEQAGVRFVDDAAVQRLARRLAVLANRRLDDAQPFVDAQLPGDVRLHAVLAPVAGSGTAVSLRVLRPAAATLDSLAELGLTDPATTALLRRIVAARLAVVVSGGTGSGKTTLLAALLAEVSPSERIITVEDAGELRPRHPHVVRLVARPRNAENAGGVGLRELVRQALRMRPDRLVVGEVRGAEVVDLLAAMNTGHQGGGSTIHANRAAEVPARLTALAALGGMNEAAAHAQLRGGLEVVLHLERSCVAGTVVRRLTEIGVVTPGGGDRVEVRAAHYGRDGPGPAADVLASLLDAREPR